MLIKNDTLFNVTDEEIINGHFTIPNSVTKIGNWAFWGCTGLTSVTIPNNITSIGEAAFENCTGLTSVTIGSGVTSIDRYAFFYCTGLTEVTIGKGVKIIGANAFEGCKSLKTNILMPCKATDGNMSCRGFQYELGKWYREDNIELCHHGFHSCQSPLDIFNYYNGYIGKNVRFFLCETDGKIIQDEFSSKIVSEKIRLVKELTLSELADYASGRLDVQNFI